MAEVLFKCVTCKTSPLHCSVPNIVCKYCKDQTTVKFRENLGFGENLGCKVPMVRVCDTTLHRLKAELFRYVLGGKV